MSCVLPLLATLFVTGNIFAADTNVASPRKIAIIVENHAGAALNDKTDTLEDLVASRVAGQGFSVISRDVVVNALKSAPAGSSSNLDEELSRNTSALRLAQNLGADFILVPTITSYGTEKKSYNGNGIQTWNTIRRLRVSFKIANADDGGALRGGTFAAEKVTRDTGNLQTEDTDTLNELLDDAASQLAAAVNASAQSLPAETGKAALVSFKISCSMSDLSGQAITVPDLRLTTNGHVISIDRKLEVQPLDVTVELDGLAIGSAPSEFKARPGLHKMRLAREGFSDWERTVNIYDGQTLRVAMQMNEQGYARWKELSEFLWKMEKDKLQTGAAIEKDSKLTDAQIERQKALTPGELEVLKGQAQMLRQSGFKVNYKVDTKDNIKIENKSLF